jgi:mono/diheme cytochrome c family protein
MLKRLLLIAGVITLAVNFGYADQSRAKMTIQISKVASTSGKQMYANYCTPCHGMDGRGHGPIAPALKTPPADLTALSRNHRGKFPDTHIVAVLENGAELGPRRAAEMPVWGPILGKMNQTTPQDRLLRICNLSRYLDTIQSK